MSVPSLALWSRKIALQSEGLAALVQSSSAKLLSHQEQLQDILNSCKAEIAGAKEEIEASTKQRDDNGTNSVSHIIYSYYPAIDIKCT